MEQNQALIDALIRQRVEAMNRAAEFEARLVVALSEIEKMRNPPEGDPATLEDAERPIP